VRVGTGLFKVKSVLQGPRPGSNRGFTLVEMLVTVVIVAVLASAVFPLTHLAHKRNKETQLRNRLEQIRSAIDAYKRAADGGHIILKSGDSGYPPNLQVLMDGVVDAKPGPTAGAGSGSGNALGNGSGSEGIGAVRGVASIGGVAGGASDKNASIRRIYFLRHIPRDPMNDDATLSASETWGLRSYASSYEEPRVGVDVFDVYSKSTQRGMNDQPYNTW